MRKNITLIGMPSCGKSTIGVVLAKVLGYRFVDSDLLIQEQEDQLLHEIIRDRGYEAFAKIEEEVNASIGGEKKVIATGGSVIYGQKAMEHFSETTTIVYIRLPLEEIKHRVGNIRRRGVLLKDGQTLDELYDERCPLYEKYAHIIVDSKGLSVEQLMDEILWKLQ